MTSSEPIATELKSLFSGVSGIGDRHLAQVETDLLQMNILLGEAIKKLGTSFMAIHGALSIQQETMNLVLCGGTPAPECITRLETIHDEIGQYVNAAVTGLQFEDMTSQLMGKMALHLAGLREVFGALDTGGSSVSPASNPTELVSSLNGINQMLAQRNTALESNVRNAVNQRHMESGEIELF
jgi:dihydroxyacetone kinase DhaKLM complex PTS-EIIA-like component DhaM